MKRSLAKAELEQCKLGALKSVDDILSSEIELIFTQNTPCFETEQRKWYQHYHSIRYPPLTSILDVYPNDEYSEEMRLMSRVHAYFRIALKVSKDRPIMKLLSHFLVLANN